MKMMESGQIGWVEREVQARQWADQVGEDVGVGVDQVCPGEEGGAE